MNAKSVKAADAASAAAGWVAGAAQVDVTPTRSQFLFGYPHVKRYSAGVHDPLLASSLFIRRGEAGVLFVACDVILVPRWLTLAARQRISQLTGLAPERVMITATHTHSGPITGAMVSNAADPTVPPPDPGYLAHLETGIVRSAVQAYRAAQPARLQFALADGSGLGTNRRDPAGPRIPEVPVLVARDARSDAIMGVMCVVSMHPTVLHEGWPLVSGDFPGLARRWLQQHAIGRNCPFIYHMGAAGNQSPRHVVQANTIEEALRLGEMLGRAVSDALERTSPVDEPILEVRSAGVDLPLRPFPSVKDAAAALAAARDTLSSRRTSGQDRSAIRTAECDVFGAEETLTLSRASHSGALADAARECLPAEVQLVRIGGVCFVGWPGEVFVEFALEVRRRHPEAHLITLANSDLQGYLVTQAAVDEGAYEAGNAIFASPVSGNRLVDATLSLLRASKAGGAKETLACRAS